MNNLNAIGLDQQLSEQLAVKLNDLLANYSIFYQNTRGFHWNIKGEKFFELHLKFEELYNDLLLKIDEVAERILTLGHAPLAQHVPSSEFYKTLHCSRGFAIRRVLSAALLSGVSQARKPVKMLAQSTNRRRCSVFLFQTVPYNITDQK